MPPCRTFFAAALTIASMLAVPRAQAATHCVTPGGTGGCLGSVQEAVDGASSGDTVEIAAGTYVESVTMPPRKRLTLRGAGAGATVLDGDGAFAVVHFTGPNNSPVVIEGLTIRNGGRGVWVQTNVKLDLRDCEIRDNVEGGGLDSLNGNRLSLTGCLVTANSGGEAGGITMKSGNLTLVASTVSGNDGPRAGGIEGGIGTVTVLESTISGNASGQAGGGIRSSGKVTVTRSTVSGNQAAENGGGIHLSAGGRQLAIASSTISGNTAGTDGGGVHVVSHRRLTLDHATIAGNSAAGLGGGIYARTFASPKPTTVRASILADNTAAGDPDCSADRVVASDGNLIEDQSGCTHVALQGSAVLAVDPLLGPLQDNGGPTATHAPAAGSAALGAVSASRSCKGVDQRGVGRAVPCDLGAVEVP